MLQVLTDLTRVILTVLTDLTGFNTRVILTVLTDLTDLTSSQWHLIRFARV